MSSLRVAGAVLGVLAAVSLGVVQFLPWGTVSDSFFGASFSVEARTWRLEMEGGFGGEGGSDRMGWYSNEVEDEEEGSDADVAKIRIAIPLLLGGLLSLAVGALLGFVLRGPAAGVLLLIGAVLAAAGTILFAMGVDGLFDSEQDWGAAFYLAIAATVLGLVGGVLALARGRAA